MKKYFEFTKEESVSKNEILLYPITSEEIMLTAKKNIDEKHLYRMYIALSCCHDFREKIKDIVEKVIEHALDDDDPLWKDIDKLYVRNTSND